jgi:hypothetical protein
MSPRRKVNKEAGSPTLEESGIPYMFYGGYGGDLQLSFRKALIVPKPATGGFSSARDDKAPGTDAHS